MKNGSENLRKTMRRALMAGVAVAGLAAGSHAYASILPTVFLKTSVDSGSLHVGETTTITVSAEITDGAAGNGITAFDIDLFPLVKSGIHFTGAAVQGSGTALSAGTADGVTGGLLGIQGVFSSPGVGVGSFVTLFTVQVQADAVGSNSISAGLSVEPLGVGIPFVVNGLGNYVPPGGGTATFNVDTSGAIAAVNVTAVPEPAFGAALGVMAWGFLLKRRRNISI